MTTEELQKEKASYLHNITELQKRMDHQTNELKIQIAFQKKRLKLVEAEIEQYSKPTQNQIHTR